jgi:hypothetical protein
MSAAQRVKTAFQNALDLRATEIQKITRAVNAEYAKMPATEISTGVSGIIVGLTYESSYTNPFTGEAGDWNVVIEVKGYGFLNLQPAYIQVEV